MEKILTITTEFICLSEEDAAKLVEEKRDRGNVEKYNVTYKKPTAKKSEHWIVVIKERIETPDTYILNE